MALHVTHHALVRFLERVRGFQFEREKAEILRICNGVSNGTVKFEGCTFEIKNDSVVTVMPDSGSPSRTKRLEVRALTL